MNYDCCASAGLRISEGARPTTAAEVLQLALPQHKPKTTFCIVQAHRGVVAGSAPAAYYMPPARAREAIAPLVAAAAMDASPAAPPHAEAHK